jgi:DNA-3-methyladenine glycosylase II
VPLLYRDPFTALIRSISAQQVNLRWAATIRARLAQRYGTRHAVGEWAVWSLQPGLLAEARLEDLRELQLTTAKSLSVIDVARAAQAGELRLQDLDALDDEQVITHLAGLRGIGRWSAEWFLARTLGRPRVVAGDLGVRKAIGRLYATPAIPSELEVRRLTAHWGAAATHAQALTLHDLAQP